MTSAKINALVAERIMGWTRYEGEAIPECPSHPNPDNRRFRHTDPDEAARQVAWIDGDELKACSVCGTLPNFCGDWGAVRQMEAKIGEGYDPRVFGVQAGQDRVHKYLRALHDIVGAPDQYDACFRDEWMLLRATPMQRCLAALKAAGVEVPA